jgi:hypothetical protein
MASLGSACASPVRACWSPADATPGWKEVALPTGAKALAAPPDVDQYRPGEPALAWQERTAQPTPRLSGGSANLVLDVDGERAEALEVTFEARLGGAAVEAYGLTPTGSYVVRPRARSHDTTVRLDLADPTTSAVVVTVRHHLRAAPRLVSWRVGRWQHPVGPPATLLYRQPAGRTLLLCDAPGRPLAFHPSWQAEPPRPVAMAPTLASRLGRWVWR